MCEVAHTCNSGTCHIWPHFYETAKFLWHYTRSFLNKLATCLTCWILGHSFAFSAALSVSVRPPYAGRPEVLYNFYIKLYMSRNPYLLTEFPVASTISILYLQAWIVRGSLLVVTGTLLSYKSLLIKRGLFTSFPNWSSGSAVSVYI